MKKVALITTNRILAQSLAAAIKAMPDFNFEFFMLLDLNQALIDAEIFEIDIALIDVMERGAEEKDSLMSFCESLHQRLPQAHLLLLLSQDDPVRREMATEAKKKAIVDDFVFYDASLKYLFAKLSAF
ncbi:MAG: hypothetical protein GX947_02925 [Tissierellia bacterium]|nr:hypothetical protein [Tissierellia bacterium]